MNRTIRAYERDAWRRRHAFWHPYRTMSAGRCLFRKRQHIEETRRRNREMHQWLRGENMRASPEDRDEQ